MLILDSSTQNLLNELKKFSPKTYEHSVNVSNLCDSFGKRIGLNYNEIDKLKIAALLHDIGKLRIPENILNKPSKLTDEEYKIAKKHAIYGVELLIKAGLKNKEILDIILSHHERVDGLGYPKGLKNDTIPYLSKILSICDSYDAMRFERTYKDAYDLEYIKNEFIENSGTQFDTTLVNQFLNFIDEINLGPKHIK